jgi:hypothetical protein
LQLWHLFSSQKSVQTSHGFSYIERMASFLCKPREISLCIFIKKFMWRLYTETITAKALRTFISIYILLKSERLSVGTKLTLHKALIRFMLTYAYPALKFVMESYLLKFQYLQNKVMHAIGNLPRRTPTHDLHVMFKILYLNSFVTKLCRQQATVIVNHANFSICSIGQGAS